MNIPSLSNRRFTTIVLTMTVLLLFADQNLLAPNLSLIAKEFGMTDKEKNDKLGAAIAFGFFVLGAPVAITVGLFADLVNRCILFGVLVCIGSMASTATFFVSDYNQLFWCRACTGISIGGAGPIIYSLLADYYAGKSRIKVATLVGVAVSFGISFGQLLSGLVGPTYGWRTPFLLIAIPTFASSMLIILCATEPLRGGQEEEVVLFRAQISQIRRLQPVVSYDEKDESENTRILIRGLVGSVPYSEEGELAIEAESEAPLSEQDMYKERVDLSKIGHLFKTPTVLLVYAQGLPGCIPWGMIYVYFNDYFSSNRGLSIASASVAMTLIGLGGLAGQLVGGIVGQILYNQTKWYISLVMGLSTTAGILPMLYIINTPAGTISFFTCCALAGFIVSITGPNVKSETRGTAFAFFNLADDLGKGFGPVVVAAMVSYFDNSRNIAFNYCIVLWLISGTLLFLTSFTLEHDERVVQAKIRNVLLDSISE